VDQFPKAGISVDKNHPITLKLGKSTQTNPELAIGKGTMPNLVGMTLRKAVQAASDNGVAIRILGSGVVRKQSILPGSKISGGSVCLLEATI
jgi:beta-lactam-binding protein with PASTA domain